MNIPDDAVEAAAKAIFECRGTGLNWDDPAHNDEPTRIRYRVQAQAALDAAIPHILTHRAESLRAATDCEVAQSIRVSLAMGLKTAARLLETDGEKYE